MGSAVTDFLSCQTIVWQLNVALYQDGKHLFLGGGYE
jgi:hypothetical protein